MSDETQVASGQDAGQSAANAQPQESVEKPVDQQQEQASQEEAQPKPFTREDAERLKQDILNEARSYSDKGRVKLQQRMQAVEQTIETAKEYGKPFSEDEAATMRSKAFNAAMKDASQGETEGEATAQRPDLQYNPSEFYQEGFRLEGKHGLTVEQGDPEMSMIKITGNKEADLKSLRDAFAAKAKRTSQNASTTKTTTEEATTTGNASRVPIQKGPKPQPKRSPEEKISAGLGGEWKTEAPPEK